MAIPIHITDQRSRGFLDQLREQGPVKGYLADLQRHHDDTYEHSLRVALLSIDLGYENEVADADRRSLSLAGLLHDLGKTDIDEAILSKASSLGEEERTAEELWRRTQSTQFAIHCLLRVNSRRAFLCSDRTFPVREWDMSLSKKYDPTGVEQSLRSWWEDRKIFRFDASGAPVRAVDTPPATVSGALHLGHAYSYTHADFMARHWRMSGYRVFYPMGFDDNGLPTERLVEKELNIDLRNTSRSEFGTLCRQVADRYEREYEDLWRRLALSVDWRHTYRTISEETQRLSQWSFVDLHGKNLVYRSKSPTIWCPECRTAVAQAELEEVERESEYVYLQFLVAGKPLSIGTTRPELLPACVAVFVHPQDSRYRGHVGKEAMVPGTGPAGANPGGRGRRSRRNRSGPWVMRPGERGSRWAYRDTAVSWGRSEGAGWW